MLDVGRLRALLAISEHGGIPGAARALSASAADVHEQLSALEQSLGVTLVDGDRLTPAGQRVASSGSRALAALAEVEAAASTAGGTLRLGVESAAGRALLPEALGLLDGVSVVVGPVESSSDVAVVAAYEAAVPRRADPSVSRQELLTEPLLLAVPAAHRLAGRSTGIRLADLADERWVVGTGDGLVAFERAAAAAGFEPVVAGRVPEDQLALTLVAAGHGVALVPASGVPARVDGVRLLPVVDAALRRTVSVLVPRRSAGDAAVRRVVDALATAARRVAAAVPGVTASPLGSGALPTGTNGVHPLGDPLPSWSRDRGDAPAEPPVATSPESASTSAEPTTDPASPSGTAHGAAGTPAAATPEPAADPVPPAGPAAEPASPFSTAGRDAAAEPASPFAAAGPDAAEPASPLTTAGPGPAAEPGSPFATAGSGPAAEPGSPLAAAGPGSAGPAAEVPPAPTSSEPASPFATAGPGPAGPAPEVPPAPTSSEPASPFAATSGPRSPFATSPGFSRTDPPAETPAGRNPADAPSRHAAGPDLPRRRSEPPAGDAPSPFAAAPGRDASADAPAAGGGLPRRSRRDDSGGSAFPFASRADLPARDRAPGELPAPFAAPPPADPSPDLPTRRAPGELPAPFAAEPDLPTRRAPGELPAPFAAEPDLPTRRAPGETDLPSRRAPGELPAPFAAESHLPTRRAPGELPAPFAAETTSGAEVPPRTPGVLPPPFAAEDAPPAGERSRDRRPDPWANRRRSDPWENRPSDPPRPRRADPAPEHAVPYPTASDLDVRSLTAAELGRRPNGSPLNGANGNGANGSGANGSGRSAGSNAAGTYGNRAYNNGAHGTTTNGNGAHGSGAHGGGGPGRRGRDDGPDTLPPAPAGTEDVRLSIFEELQSEWFTRRDEPGTPAGRTPWDSPADDGWRAAARLADPTTATAGTTTAGLPRRKPQALYVPGTASGESTPPQVTRSATEVRGRLSSYRDGVRRGRHSDRTDT